MSYCWVSKIPRAAQETPCFIKTAPVGVLNLPVFHVKRLNPETAVSQPLLSHLRESLWWVPVRSNAVICSASLASGEPGNRSVSFPNVPHRAGWLSGSVVPRRSSPILSRPVPQPLQANSYGVSQIGHGLFLSNLFQIIVHVRAMYPSSVTQPASESHRTTAISDWQT
jgi:hypothetical protein